MSGSPAAAGSVPAERYAQRIARAQAEASEQGVAALLIGVGSDLRWLTGYAAMPLKRLTMLVVPAKGEATMVAPRLEILAARASTAVGAGLVKLASWEETDDPIQLVAQQPAVRVAAERGGRLLVSDRLAAAFLLPLSERVAPARLGLATEVLGRLRAVKDADEVGLLRRAAQAADRVVAGILGGRLVGRNESDVAREVRTRLEDEGHSEAAFWIVASGPNSASPHHDAGDRVIAAGEPIVLDIGGRIEGYGSDITRTIWVTGGHAEGGPDDTYRGLFAALQEAQEQASRGAVAGASAQDVDGIARRIISNAGYGQDFIHRTGHGIGLDGHEDPYLVAGNEQLLRPGNAFSVEPGIYLEGRYGARIEDIVVCTEGAPDVLNQAPRALAVVSGA
ncbi:Xaa-Pro peptidase family protein [soil metagenome]